MSPCGDSICADAYATPIPPSDTAEAENASLRQRIAELEAMLHLNDGTKPEGHDCAWWRELHHDKKRADAERAVLLEEIISRDERIKELQQVGMMVVAAADDAIKDAEETEAYQATLAAPLLQDLQAKAQLLAALLHSDTEGTGQ